MIYEHRCDLDQNVRTFKAPYQASSEAVLTPLSAALVANIDGRPVPKKVAVAYPGGNGPIREVTENETASVIGSLNAQPRSVVDDIFG